LGLDGCEGAIRVSGGGSLIGRVYARNRKSWSSAYPIEPFAAISFAPNEGKGGVNVLIPAQVHDPALPKMDFLRELTYQL
jgi:hypothetical protein